MKIFLKQFRLIGLLSLIFLNYNCATIKPATSVVNGSLKSFKYVYVSPSNTVYSSSGSTINGQYYSTSKSVNPSELISGIMAKEGFVILPELNPDVLEETLIANYGESGRRNTGLGGYAIEVTIQFISAKTNALICSCTAEGIGSTEVDDIRKAIIKCLNELKPKSN